jgi:hypothetical protein
VDYAVLYNALSDYDWSSLYNETAVDTTVGRFKSCCNSSHRFSFFLDTSKSINILLGSFVKSKAYIKKIIFIHVTSSKRLFYDKISFYHKLVKETTKNNRFRWLKSVEENPKSHSKQFWKYVSQFRKINTDLIHLETSMVF